MKRAIISLLSLIILFSSFIAPISILAEDELTKAPTKDYETIEINVDFCTSGRQWNYSFPYSDDWFKEADDHYNHKLAQGSFGLTVASFRFIYEELGLQDRSLIKYYEDAGFTNIETYNYENSPTDDSISNGIASKKIDDFTLLAVGVCGSGYGDEWCSNLTIGKQLRHYGFEDAAKQVEERIENYITKYNITGNIKVWLTGFSRASAVSNLVAADLTDSGKYAGVYGYHFAVPNNTTEAKQYNNIFCIVGPNDPVPYVALEEWGYSKNGTILYTPSKETDSYFSSKYAKASEVYESITGEQLLVSPAINKSIRLILISLLDMIPNREVYVNDLQADVLTAWHAKGNRSDLITFLAGVLDELGKMNTEIQDKTSQLGEYILNLGVEFTTKNPNSVFASDLYEEFNLAANLVREHQPMTYMAWLFSNDDPSLIYCNNIDFIRLFIYGDVVISVYDDEGLIEIIEDGFIKRGADKNSYVVLSSNYNFLYSKQEGDKTELIIPKDKNYLIEIRSSSGSINYEGVSFSGRSIIGKQIESVEIPTLGDTSYYILSRATVYQESSFNVEQDYELIETSNYASPAVLLAMENSNIFHLTFKQMMNFGKINIALLILFLFFNLLRIFRVKILKKKASRIVTFCMNLSVSFICILLYEQANIYLDSIPVVRTILGILTMLSVLHLCYTTMKPINRRLAKFFLVAIFFVAFGNAAKQYVGVDFATFLYSSACLIITIGIMSETKPQTKQMYVWLVISTLLSLMASKMIGSIIIMLIIYIFAAVSMNVAAMLIDLRLRVLIGAFMLPSCLSVWESYTGGNVKTHTLLVLGYSLLLLLIIAIILYKSYKIEKDYELKRVDA